MLISRVMCSVTASKVVLLLTILYQEYFFSGLFIPTNHIYIDRLKYCLSLLKFTFFSEFQFNNPFSLAKFFKCTWNCFLSHCHMAFYFIPFISPFSTPFQKISIIFIYYISLIQYSLYCMFVYFFSSVAQQCPTVCNLMDCGTSGLPVHYQHLEIAQTHVH